MQARAPAPEGRAGQRPTPGRRASRQGLRPQGCQRPLLRGSRPGVSCRGRRGRRAGSAPATRTPPAARPPPLQGAQLAAAVAPPRAQQQAPPLPGRRLAPPSSRSQGRAQDQVQLQLLLAFLAALAQDHLGCLGALPARGWHWTCRHEWQRRQLLMRLLQGRTTAARQLNLPLRPARSTVHLSLSPLRPLLTACKGRSLSRLL
jgi:hypothetical protein